MAKRRDAPYLPGRRSSAWWKVKCGRRREFVVGGRSTGQGSRESSIGSLALGCYDTDDEDTQRLFYVGQAGSGLNEEMIRQLQKLFGGHHRHDRRPRGGRQGLPRRSTRS